jgi:transposase InsO family protein
MQEMAIGAPFERIGIDLTGPHPPSRRGHVYILTYVDHFTKWAEAIPLRNKEASTIANALIYEIFPRLGLPRHFLSDNGRKYRNQLLEELSVQLNIDGIFTTPYTPSTNGAIERLHRTMNSMLSKVIVDNQKIAVNTFSL